MQDRIEPLELQMLFDKVERVVKRFPQAKYKFNHQHQTLDIWSDGQTSGKPDMHLTIDSCSLWMLDSIKME